MSKFRVTLKDPDTLYDAISEQLDKELEKMDEDEAEAVRDIRQEKYGEIASKWFRYGEYLTVEIDTEANTCVVILSEDES